MAIQVDEDGRAMFPSRVKERQLEDLAAEILRHEKRKRELGSRDIADRALHYRAKRIIKR